MRILGFSKKEWINYLTGSLKLGEDEFTTFRFPRRDRDWEVGELVQVIYKPRRKGGGEKLGVAEIIGKELKRWTETISKGEFISTNEALADGFLGIFPMYFWMEKTYGDRILNEPMNKLTLRWIGSE